jgi:actin-like ATPase involved in cell morphogenesis
MNQLENNLERITAILKTIEETPPNLKSGVVNNFAEEMFMLEQEV